MCLRRAKVKPILLTGYVVRNSARSITGRRLADYHSITCGNFLPQKLGEWLDEGEYRYRHIEDDEGIVYQGSTQRYPRGWHVFHRLADARMYSRNTHGRVVLKVAVREHLVSGMQEYSNMPVSVFRKIKLLREVAKKC